jgi:tetratricopeptide (TPR) repeat protein
MVAAATVSEWRRDIELIVGRIRQLHPRPWAEVGEQAFNRRAEELKDALPQLTEEQRAVRTMQLAALLQDRATAVEIDSPEFALWYPIRLYEFTDGYFITAAHKTVGQLAGAQLLEIAGRPAGEVVNAARMLQSSHSDAQRKERLFAFHNAALMRGLGFAGADGSLRVKLRLRNGRIIERTLPALQSDSPLFGKVTSGYAWADLTEVFGTPIGPLEDWIAAYSGLSSIAFRQPDPKRPLHLQYRRVFHTRALPDQGAYYAQINAVSNARDETFEAFSDRMLKEVDAARPKRLILDFRYNPGGDGSKALPLIREFIKREDSRPWQELYILTGRRTGGAAIIVINEFIKNVPLSLVGEPTGPPLNMASDAVSFAYPATKLRQDVTIRRTQMGNSDDVSLSLPVDVPAAFSFADFTAGRDPALDPILSGQEMRSIAVIALAEGGLAARQAHERRKPLLARYPWWAKPRFDDVKSVGYVLLRSGRAPDAMQIFALMTELYPDHWNSWESLGRAQTAANLKAEARQSYRCALALDPENWDSGDLKTALAEAPNEPRSLPAGCPTSTVT